MLSDRTLRLCHFFLWILQALVRGWTGGKASPPPAPLPPPPAPSSPSSLLSGARSARAKFPLSPSLPFFLPSPSSRPLFSLLPPPLLPPPAPSSPSSLPLCSPLPPPLLHPPSYPVRPLISAPYMQFVVKVWWTFYVLEYSLSIASIILHA